MKRIAACVMVFVFCTITGPVLAYAVDDPFGLGIVLGAPTGLTTKIFLNDQSALDFDVAYDFLKPAFTVTGDYLYHFNDLLPKEPVVWLRPYVGGGAFFRLEMNDDDDDDDDKNDKDKNDDDNDARLGPRFTAGLSAYFPKPHIETFIDLSPGISLFPKTDFVFGGVLGVRYFF